MRIRGISLIAALALSGGIASAAPVVFSDDFDGATTYQPPRPRQNFDGIHVHPPDVGSHWSDVYLGVLRDGITDANYPPPSPNGGFYAEPWSGSRMDGFLTTAGGNATENQLVRFTWQMYVDGYAPVTNPSGLEFIAFDTALGVGPRGTDFFLQADGTLQYYTEGAGYVQVPAQDFSFATNQWVSAELLTNYATGQTTLTIGSESHSFTVANAGANRVDHLIFIDASSGADNQSVIDNLVIEVVPEPASMGVIALAAGVLLGRRRV